MTTGPDLRLAALAATHPIIWAEFLRLRAQATSWWGVARRLADELSDTIRTNVDSAREAEDKVRSLQVLRRKYNDVQISAFRLDTLCRSHMIKHFPDVPTEDWYTLAEELLPR